MLMLMVGGIGIDFMRSEMRRTQVQQTLDRAILAAADLDQQRAPKEVVADYFAKSGMSDYLSSITVTENSGFRTVSATASTDMDTQFMKLLGYKTLTIPSRGTAGEKIGAVEVSLVLDISGSMYYNSRLTNLKTAAKKFVDLLLDESNGDFVSISIIPYATQVNAGATLLSKYNVTSEHNYSHCVNFISDQFSKSTLYHTELLERTAHFDPFTESEGTIDMPVCPTRASSEIFPFSNNKTDLHTFIEGLTPGGNTSVDLGVKWGTALLDPSARPVINSLITDGEISSAFSNRPTDYGNPNIAKVIVVMSDGANTDQYFLNPSIREGLSDVWYNAEEDRYSIYHSNGEPMYYWPHTETWNDHPYGAGSAEACNFDSSGTESCSVKEEPGTAVRLTYPELLNRVSLKWNALHNYEFTSSAWADWYESAFAKLETSAKDQRTLHICDAAKDQGVMVFAIGFEAPSRGNRILRDCASSDSHFFDADGLDIVDAFASIARSISQLKLLQ